MLVFEIANNIVLTFSLNLKRDFSM